MIGNTSVTYKAHESEGPEAIVYTDHDDVGRVAEPLVVVEDVGPRDEGAAVDEHHHGQVRRQVHSRRIPDREIKLMTQPKLRSVYFYSHLGVCTERWRQSSSMS